MLFLATLMALSPTADAGRLGIFAPLDEDGDGVPDRRDSCLAAKETPNGYADDDGCPDHLAVLDVLPRIGDTLVPADVRITRATGATTASGVPRVADDLVPGETVTVEATALCYEARGTLVVGQGRNHLDLELTPRYDRALSWSLTDADGAPLAGAKIQFDSLCAPQQPVMLASGHGTIRVGAGAHVVRIEAPGFEPEIRTVSADSTRVAIALAPTRIDPTDAVVDVTEDTGETQVTDPGEA
ncbi:MAG: hypothetical protein AAF211_24540 [Myxococcota bacterium]